MGEPLRTLAAWGRVVVTGSLEPNVNAVFGSTVLTGSEALLKRLSVSASDRVLNCGCVYKDPIA